jgi:hypothetical protein
VKLRSIARSGLVGTRGHLGERAAEWVAKRTRLDADTLKLLVGAYLVVSRVNSFRKMAQRARAENA